MASDDFRDVDLRGFDLDQLDLDHIEFEEERASPIWRWILGLGLLATTATLLWAPRSSLYQSLNAPWLSFVFSFAGILVGLLSGRFLWSLLTDMTPSTTPARVVSEPEGPPSATRRFLNLLVVIGGAGAIVYITHTGQVGQSGGTWFLVSVGAIVVGITFGRWLTMQAQVAEPVAEEVEPVELPPWFKWITLSFMLVAGVAIALGTHLFAISEEVSLGLGAGGFILGIIAAIWLSRRFEEAEERIKSERRVDR